GDRRHLRADVWVLFVQSTGPGRDPEPGERQDGAGRRAVAVLLGVAGSRAAVLHLYLLELRQQRLSAGAHSAAVRLDRAGGLDGVAAGRAANAGDSICGAGRPQYLDLSQRTDVLQPPRRP